MYNDLILVLGVTILALSFPAIVGSFSRGDPPRKAILALVLGGCMFVYANMANPGGYPVAGIPEVFVRVLTGTS